MQDEAPTSLKEDHASRTPTREQRLGRLFASTMRIPGLGERPVTIRNLSPSGAGLRSDKPPPIGTMVILALGHYGDINARVRWVEGRLFGVTLAEEIDPESFNFASKSWGDVSGGHAAHFVADRFRPETNTYRPGFRLR
jgi:PilZ domain